MRDLAAEALAEGAPLRKIIADRGIGKPVNLAAALKEKRVLIPLDHDDPAHVHVTGTGLTHLGSAEGRDKMHRTLADATTLTDSMKMFKLGLDGGKPAPGATGVQPEWFYKGDGSTLVAPGGDLVSPSFALDGGEEPEIVGLYVIDDDGQPVRLGFALGNEFSDHVMERQNYLYLAHSKLRPASVGPELLVGDLPADVRGVSRIRRGKEIVVGEAVRLRRTQHVAHDRQSRGAPFQIRAVPPAGRRPRPFLRHGDAVLRRRLPRREGRRVRDRVRALRPAAAQPADDRQAGQGEAARAVSRRGGPERSTIAIPPDSMTSIAARSPRRRGPRARAARRHGALRDGRNCRLATYVNLYRFTEKGMQTIKETTKRFEAAKKAAAQAG